MKIKIQVIDKKSDERLANSQLIAIATVSALTLISQTQTKRKSARKQEN